MQVNRVTRWDGNMEVRVEKKGKKNNSECEQPKKVDYGTMMVNT